MTQTVPLRPAPPPSAANNDVLRNLFGAINAVADYRARRGAPSGAAPTAPPHSGPIPPVLQDDVRRALDDAVAEVFRVARSGWEVTGGLHMPGDGSSPLAAPPPGRHYQDLAILASRVAELTEQATVAVPVLSKQEHDAVLMTLGDVAEAMHVPLMPPRAAGTPPARSLIDAARASGQNDGMTARARAGIDARNRGQWGAGPPGGDAVIQPVTLALMQPVGLQGRGQQTRLTAAERPENYLAAQLGELARDRNAEAMRMRVGALDAAVRPALDPTIAATPGLAAMTRAVRVALDTPPGSHPYVYQLGRAPALMALARGPALTLVAGSPLQPGRTGARDLAALDPGTQDVVLGRLRSELTGLAGRPGTALDALHTATLRDLAGFVSDVVLRPSAHLADVEGLARRVVDSLDLSTLADISARTASAPAGDGERFLLLDAARANWTSGIVSSPTGATAASRAAFSHACEAITGPPELRNPVAQVAIDLRAHANLTALGIAVPTSITTRLDAAIGPRMMRGGRAQRDEDTRRAHLGYAAQQSAALWLPPVSSLDDPATIGAQLSALSPAGQARILDEIARLLVRAERSGLTGATLSKRHKVLVDLMNDHPAAARRPDGGMWPSLQAALNWRPAPVPPSLAQQPPGTGGPNDLQRFTREPARFVAELVRIAGPNGGAAAARAAAARIADRIRALDVAAKANGATADIAELPERARVSLRSAVGQLVAQTHPNVDRPMFDAAVALVQTLDLQIANANLDRARLTMFTRAPVPAIQAALAAVPSATGDRATTEPLTRLATRVLRAVRGIESTPDGETTALLREVGQVLDRIDPTRGAGRMPPGGPERSLMEAVRHIRGVLAAPPDGRPLTPATRARMGLDTAPTVGVI